MLKRSERAVKKKEILKKITEIYHRENGVPGYRMMANELKKTQDISQSKYCLFLHERVEFEINCTAAICVPQRRCTQGFCESFGA